jgi:hypothetical protein
MGMALIKDDISIDRAVFSVVYFTTVLVSLRLYGLGW